ncbi:Hypothetical Protein FCC1311_029612 [Hondaea fermentalgiana]|uniref:Uncharacterized protein n=1 Tax=Hondaea fermentalgiana TaxID=2315210 RepID=A0A2R5G6X2_9STRA|nr:Hypothetical Protein FCC1311_029612 [Hondaea fermentalgiana]|eukprot:GBG26740.1 Hypothetical Protein FCC1311_029612 [Hondaea fermentalgiana]
MILWPFSDEMSPINFVDYYAGFAPVASSTANGKDPNEHLRKGSDRQGDYIFSVAPGVIGPGSRCTGCQRIINEVPRQTTVDVLSSPGTGTIESLRHRREHEPSSNYRLTSAMSIVRNAFGVHPAAELCHLNGGTISTAK